MLYMTDFLERQLASFEELPFGVLDATALSQIAMVHAKDTMPSLPGKRPRAGLRTLFGRHDAQPPVHFIDMLRAEHFATMFASLLDPDKAKEALFGVAASPRYRAMLALNYQDVFDASRQVQFAAMTFVYKDLFTCVSFRGTDTSRVGWREDFNMAFTMPVPAQDLAQQYLESVAAQKHLPGPLYVVGHSKGGNLAEYAALRCAPHVQERIAHVYNLDGPGFKAGTFTQADYKPLAGKLTKIVPEESLVGIMLDSDAPVHVAVSDATGLEQHSAFTWQVNDELTDFVYLPGLPESTQVTARTLHAWLSEYDDAEREKMVDAFFEAIEVSHAHNPVDFLRGGTKGLSLLLEASRKLDKPDRDVLLSAARSFVKALSQNAHGTLGAAASAVTNIADRLAPHHLEQNE